MGPVPESDEVPKSEIFNAERSDRSTSPAALNVAAFRRFPKMMLEFR